MKTRHLALLAASLSAAPRAQALLVSSRFTDQILEYAPDGRFVRVFASGGGLVNPVGLTFGPDGALYVASGNTHEVLRFDGVSGAFLGVAVAAGGLLRAPRNLVFGPGGDLYVGSVLGNVVLRFDGRTGAGRGVWTAAHLNGPHDIAFGPDGLVYVSNAFGAEKVVRFTAAGGFVDVFVNDPTLVNPLGLAWTAAGDLLIANQGGDDVRRHDGATGQPRPPQVPPGSGGLDGPLFVVQRDRPGRFATLTPRPQGTGPAIHFPIAGSRAGGLVVLLGGALPGHVPLPWPDQALRIGDPLLLAFGLADEGGNLVWRLPVPAAMTGAMVRLQALDLTGLVASTLAEHRF